LQNRPHNIQLSKAYSQLIQPIATNAVIAVFRFIAQLWLIELRFHVPVPETK